MFRALLGAPSGLHGGKSADPPAQQLRRQHEASGRDRASSGTGTVELRSAREWGVPRELARELDTWGLSLRQKVRACREQWIKKHMCGARLCELPKRDNLHVGTDCSGAEAPIWSLRAMGIPHKHCFSCDQKPKVREYIRAACTPEGPIFENMLSRPSTSVPQHSVYVCGFPCTPFSRLRQHSTRLLREPAAKPMYGALRTVREMLPAVAIFENVIGLDQVMGRVCGCLRRLSWYWTFAFKIDSHQLGEPVRRPRYYFILVRKDLVIASQHAQLVSLARAMYLAAQSPCSSTVAQRILPSSSLAVQKFQAGRRAGLQDSSCSSAVSQ